MSTVFANVTFKLLLTTIISSIIGHRFEPKIFKGGEVTPHSLPYQAYYKLNYTYFCGASVISPNYLLTASHCFFRDQFSILHS
jgi:secreted trypsin-like serine protease